MVNSWLSKNRKISKFFSHNFKIKREEPTWGKNQRAGWSLEEVHVESSLGRSCPINDRIDTVNHATEIIGIHLE
jgi:hypothetical protein